MAVFINNSINPPEEQPTLATSINPCIPRAAVSQRVKGLIHRNSALMLN